MSKFNPNKPQRQTTYPTLADLVMLVVMFFVGAMLGVKGAAAFMAGRYGSLVECGEASLSNMISYGASMLGALVLMALYRRIRGVRGTFVRYRLKWFNGSLILVGLLSIAALGIVEEPLWTLVPNADLPNVVGFGVWGVLNTVVLAPVLEELIFRGVILETVRSRWGKVWAVVVSSLLFGVSHGIPQQAINACLVGVILGTLYIATDSLLAVILLHAINNALSYMIIQSSDIMPTLRNMVESDTLYWSVYAVSAAVLVVCMSIIVATAHGVKTPIATHSTDNKPDRENV